MERNGYIAITLAGIAFASYAFLTAQWLMGIILAGVIVLVLLALELRERGGWNPFDRAIPGCDEQERGLNKTIPEWRRVLVIAGLILVVIVCLMVLFHGAGEHSVSNIYIVPAGVFSPFHDIPGITERDRVDSGHAGTTTVPVFVPAIQSGGTAIAIAVKADEIPTPYPEAKDLFIRGITLSTQYARYDESLVYFDNALAIDPRFTEAWLAKGVALHNLKCYDEAVACYDRVLAIEAEITTARDLKATSLGDKRGAGTNIVCTGYS